MSNGILRATEVFTPNDFPKYTYVERGDFPLEKKLRNALETPNTVISVSGPSKSGKTVLAERIIGIDNIVSVSGAELSAASDLWDRVLDVLEQPVTTTSQDASTGTTTGNVQVGGKGKLPFVAEASGTASLQHARAETTIIASTRGRGGLSQAESLLAGSKQVIFIDDFHYMSRETQTAVAQQIRAASGKGIKFCVASVPHRSDDVVRSNHELRGRTTHIDTSFWTVKDLAMIGERGFPELLMRVPADDVSALAVEACGSPQLMQQICLQACLHLGGSIKREKWGEYPVKGDDRKAVLEIAATHTDYSSLLRNMHTGPRPRGTVRTPHKLIDNSTGDVYRAVLLALAEGDPVTDLPYSKLIDRTMAVCVNTHPTGQGIASAVEQMAKAARDMYPDQRIFEWDASTGTGTLSIVDPYLLFYIRNSGKLASLGGR